MIKIGKLVSYDIVASPSFREAGFLDIEKIGKKKIKRLI